MKVGDLVQWSWHLNTGWAKTDFFGMVVDTVFYKTDREKIFVHKVLNNDGAIIQVREDEPTLEVVHESR